MGTTSQSACSGPSRSRNSERGGVVRGGEVRDFREGGGVSSEGKRVQRGGQRGIYLSIRRSPRSPGGRRLDIRSPYEEGGVGPGRAGRGLGHPLPFPPTRLSTSSICKTEFRTSPTHHLRPTRLRRRLLWFPPAWLLMPTGKRVRSAERSSTGRMDSIQ